MDRSKLILLVHTIKHLRLTQIYYQLYYLIRNKFFKKNYTKLLQEEVKPLSWKDSFSYNNTFAVNETFTFLNLTYKFTNNIDWNYAGYGKLWTYNLNYFDFLNQEKITQNQAIELIKNYIDCVDILKDGKEPYPISLRGINWIKFLSKNNLSDTKINQFLYNDYQTLIHNLEYHLLGNHLLENGFSLLFGAYYFKDEILYKKAKQILRNELKEQVLQDGAHFELSPMYHQILLHRLLDCINLTKRNPWKEDKLLGFMKEKAIKMLSWLQVVTYKNGNIPMVNDSAYGIGPSSQKLFEYASDLNLEWVEGTCLDSGYRKYKGESYELFVDVGNIGPEYQPGHAHSDTFSFELYVKNKPFIVDPGISTYEKNQLRLKQRQTSSHNTVIVGNMEQSQVWDGFRVAKRAKVVALKEESNYIKATHNGYKSLNVLHTRKFLMKNIQIEIEDNILKSRQEEQIAFFHFHPSVSNFNIFDNSIYFHKESVKMDFKGQVIKITATEYDYSIGFNKTEKAKKVIVHFNNTLSTYISL